MRRHLFILSILTLITGLYSQPGAAWQDPVKALSSDTVQSVQRVVDHAASSEIPVVAQNANATSPAAPVAESSSVTTVATTGQVETENVSDDNIYLRHIRTYDLPQNKGNSELPEKNFVLELQVFYPDSSYSDIILDTNAGFGIMRGILDSTEATRLQRMEIACKPSAGDDCSPEAIVVYNASAALERGHGESHVRTDILDRLRLNTDTHGRFATVQGLLPRVSEGAGIEKGKGLKIRVAYEGYYFDHGYGLGVRLTFPAGKLQHYDKVQLLANQWFTSEPDEGGRNPHMPDSVFLWLQRSYEGGDSAFPESLKNLEYPVEFIREAYAWRKGKRVNILPFLVEDSFQMLPIHSSNGPLPLGPHSDY